MAIYRICATYEPHVTFKVSGKDLLTSHMKIIETLDRVFVTVGSAYGISIVGVKDRLGLRKTYLGFLGFLGEMSRSPHTPPKQSPNNTLWFAGLLDPTNGNFVTIWRFYPKFASSSQEFASSKPAPL